MKGCLKGCFVVVVLFLVVGLGFVAAFRTGLITKTTVLNLVGLGPAEIQVDNLRDGPIQVAIVPLVDAKGSSPTPVILRLKAFDIRTYRVQNRGRYRADFGTSSGAAASLGTCALTLRSGDRYQFVTLPDKIAVYRQNARPSSGRDLVVATSALCR